MYKYLVIQLINSTISGNIAVAAALTVELFQDRTCSTLYNKFLNCRNHLLACITNGKLTKFTCEERKVDRKINEVFKF